MAIVDHLDCGDGLHKLSALGTDKPNSKPTKEM
jgi:hypothetical protein